MKKNKLLLILLLLLLMSCSFEPAEPIADAAPYIYADVLQETEPPVDTGVPQEAQEDEQEIEPPQEPTEQPVQDDEIYEPEEEPEPPATMLPPAPPREPAVLSTEALLYDFDYLANILRENFPFYGIARRKLGLDLHRQKVLARSAVQNMSVTGSDSQILSRFADIISRYIITPMRSMGHLRGLWAGSQAHKIQLALIKWDGRLETSWYPNLYAGYMLEMFTSPTAIRYYGNIILDDADIDRILQSTVVPNNVTFNIIQPGSIAYIRMNSMPFANFTPDGQLIAAFGETIEGFEHLIIDLRGNRGGTLSNFTAHIVAPLIDEPAVLTYYVFFKDGQHALMFDELYYHDLQWQIANGLVLHTDAPRFPVSEILPSLPYANADDFAYLKHGFQRQVVVHPAANRWAFDGKIWLLIDGLSFSASEIAAGLAKESGFATLVGTNTGGIFGGYTAAFIGLPNTGVIIRYDYGYVTDSQGRALEEVGIAPHIRNRAGMNALETVLALIAEGNY